MFTEAALSAHPIAWSSSLVGDRNDCDGLRRDIVMQGVGETRQDAGTKTIPIAGPSLGADGQVINCGKNVCTKSVCGQWAALEIPRVGFPKGLLKFA